MWKCNKMEEGFTLTWEDGTNVVQTEEVICGMDNECAIMPAESAEFVDVCEEVVVQQQDDDDDDDVEEEEADLVETDGNGLVYLNQTNVIMMSSAPVDDALREEFIDCEVTEVVGPDHWNADCSEIVVGSEEHIIGADEQPDDDVEIPLPTHQDQYTAARPYPCDFCSRRFRKKANLMNHMVAHQTDRPYGCNLCGVRYIRKCDLMNHLKIHAYIPEADHLEEEEFRGADDSDTERVRKRMKPFIKKRKRFRVKGDADDKYGSNSRAYGYVGEDMKLLESMDHSRSNYSRYLPQENHPTGEIRFPITDPKKPFVCQHCGVSFAREKALASHARVHGGESPFECRTCNEIFWDAELFHEHVRVKHGGVAQDYDEEEDDDDEDYSDDETRFGQFFCPSCGLAFHRQDNLKRHQRVHVKEEFGGVAGTAGAHHDDDEELGHVCNVCGDTFAEALDLLAHAEIHARTSEYRCMVCGELCADDQAVAAHVQSKHGKNLPPNTCMMCGRTCKDRRSLLKHSFEHSKEKSFGCTKCEKTFHNKARLKRHMLSHRNKAVACDVCGDAFPDGRSLMNHRHSHSSVSGRQFPCRECGKTFGSRSSQQIHIRIHTGERPYGCRFCWKAFADGGTLRKHERIHTGEKPYACAVCPRAFNQRVVLREHIRSHHSGPDPQHGHSTTPYCCAVCSDLFATSQDLIIHLIHHCDLNTAMKRQPHIGPRKYKRRRKLKPHELELMTTTRTDGEDEDEEEEEEEMMMDGGGGGGGGNYTESDDERVYKRKAVKRAKKTPPKAQATMDEYGDLYGDGGFNHATMEQTGVAAATVKTPTKGKKKQAKQDPIAVPSRPKMIHTQKARVAVDNGEGGKVRHKTRTLVTHTQPTELRSATGERIRPRTKNVSYHVVEGEKFPLATFPDEDAAAAEAVNNLLASEAAMANDGNHHHHHEMGGEEEAAQSNGLDMMEVASEQIIEEEVPVPISLIQMAPSKRRGGNTRKKKTSNSLKPGRHIIGPGSKVVRLVKGGMIVKNKTIKVEDPDADAEPECIMPDFESGISVKQEIVDSSPLHELAEISMKHAQKIFRCEMCCEIFSDREQLLEHVPIHI